LLRALLGLAGTLLRALLGNVFDPNPNSYPLSISAKSRTVTPLGKMKDSHASYAPRITPVTAGSKVIVGKTTARKTRCCLTPSRSSPAESGRRTARRRSSARFMSTPFQKSKKRRTLRRQWRAPRRHTRSWSRSLVRTTRTRAHAWTSFSSKKRDLCASAIDSELSLRAYLGSCTRQGIVTNPPGRVHERCSYRWRRWQQQRGAMGWVGGWVGGWVNG
jgi:hypothetical protein